MEQRQPGHRCEREGDIAELKANMKAAFHRIDEMRGISDTLTKLTDSMHLLAISVAKLTERMDATVNAVEVIQEDVAEIKRVPADDFRHYKRQWISGTVMLILGAVVGALLKGLVL